jgi:2-C-methyl-D-erythritol 4-phosphate cytidylyltransferase
MKKYVLIAAGGEGSRMQTSLPKQFSELAGRPMLLHTIFAFLSFAPDINIVLVLHESQTEIWKRLCEQQHFFRSHILTTGGPTRFHSVKNGLQHIPDDALVAVHDGVRPLVSLDTISRVFHFAGKFGNAIPVIKPNDSIRMTTGALSKTIDREAVRLVQTPQCFFGKSIKQSYNKNYQESYTDEASVMEADGQRLFLVEGNHENIKITHPSDLVYAEAILSGKTY